MKNMIICSLIVFWTSTILGAQTTSTGVSNVKTVVSEDRDMVTITFDLARTSNITAYNVSVKISLDGEHINALALSGDVGPNIPPGYGKRVLWDVMKDVSELYGTLSVEVAATASARPCTPIKAVPVYAGLGGVATAGLGLVVSGLKTESDSKGLYDIYKSNLDPGDSVYNEMSRDEHYEKANSKHKLGTWMAIGGGTIIVAGGAVMVSRLIQINRYNKKCLSQGYTSSCKLSIEPVFIDSGTFSSTGIGITLHF